MENSAVEENIIISANPGSGKTERISEKVVEKIKRGVRPDEILCITFTRKAMEEMQSRIERKLSQNQINAGLPRIETFHSFALSILRERGFYNGTVSERFMRYSLLRSMQNRSLMNYGAETLMKDYPTIINVGKITNAVKFLKSYGIYPAKVNRQDMKKRMERYYNSSGGISGYTQEEMLIFAEKFFDIFQDYENSKKEGYYDYNDYLVRAIEIMKKSFQKFPYLFVDEVQDISEIESEIISLAGENIFLVGDQKQAIFGFQGGNTKAFNSYLSNRKFKKENLSGTRRLSRNIKEYCTNFFLNVEKDYAGTELNNFETFVKDYDGEVIVMQPDDDREWDNIIAQIVQKKLEKIDKDETLGVIGRTNRQAEDISKALSALSIRHEKISGEGLYEDAREELAKFIRGLLSDRREHIIAMLYTPFSDLTLKDAMMYADRIKFAQNPSELIPDYLIKARERYTGGKKELRELFEEYILPMCLTKKPDYFQTARDMANTINEYFDYIGKDNFVNLDDFITFLLQDNVVDDDIPELSTVSVLTVHKAKGLEFDHVIYCPKYVSGKNPSPVDVVVDLALNQFGHSYGAMEREKEENRIDFVAMSRAKKSMIIVPEKKNVNRYRIKEISVEIVRLDKSVKNEFVSLKDLMDRDRGKKNVEPWLTDFISKKLKLFPNLSFTMISSVKKGRLEDFVKTYILGIRESSTATEFGTKIHAHIEDYIKTKNKPQNMLDPDEINAWKNFEEYDSFVRQTIGGQWIGSEMAIKKGINLILRDIHENVNIDGRIDGVYMYRDGDIEKYVIVDFKTSKKASPEYQDQLSLYAYLYSIEKSVDLKNIESEIAYVSLRDTKVNTGVMRWKNERIPYEIEIRGFQNVEENIRAFFNYRNSVNAFIRDVLDERPVTNIFKAFQDELRKEMDLR